MPVPDPQCLPTFLVIGAMKAGTTSLYDYLRAHPEVFMATPKELHFFPETKQWPLGVDWYAAHFAGGVHATARGEASPSYSQADQFPGVAKRIADVLPDVRLVYLVREPVQRLRSMYLHEVASGRETLPIERAVREKPLYVESSKYATQLDEYAPYVPRERIHVMTNEALKHDRAGELSRLYRFIGVDDGFVPPNVDAERGHTTDKRVRRPISRKLRHNAAYRALVDHLPSRLRSYGHKLATAPIDVDASVLPPDLEAELRAEFAPEVARLREYLGGDFDGWGYA
jgi:hypothetical protein